MGCNTLYMILRRNSNLHNIQVWYDQLNFLCNDEMPAVVGIKYAEIDHQQLKRLL